MCSQHHGPGDVLRETSRDQSAGKMCCVSSRFLKMSRVSCRAFNSRSLKEKCIYLQLNLIASASLLVPDNHRHPAATRPLVQFLPPPKTDHSACRLHVLSQQTQPQDNSNQTGCSYSFEIQEVFLVDAVGSSEVIR